MKLLLLFTLLALAATTSHAQAPPAPKRPAPADTLYQRIARLDAELFAAFNAHDVPKLMGYFTSDLEFYHDKGGPATPKRSRASRR